MATEIQICNLALARLGDEATVASISPPEGSAQAEHCARFYPVARDSLLELHAWKFSTRRAVLAALDTDLFGWGYAYAEPANVLRVLKVLSADEKNQAKGAEFLTDSAADGTVCIRTDLPEATALYTAKVTDTSKFSPLFVDALGWLLASHLAGPLLKGDAGRKATLECLTAARGVVAMAQASDANQRQTETEHIPAWIGGR